jgi:hypothetical protein
MKSYCKNHALLASLLVIVFFLLHYYIYLDNAGTIPILQSYTDAPVDLPELMLCEEEQARPSYLTPFQKIKYSYAVRSGDGQIDSETGIPAYEYSNDCPIIEQAESIFTSKIKPLVGDPYEYWNNFDEDSFARPLVANTYANLIFFLVQYLIIAAWITVIYRSFKSSK